MASRAAPRSVVGPSARAASSSPSTRRAWRRPFLGGTMRPRPSLKKAAPTRSFACAAVSASTAATWAASSDRVRRRLPTWAEALSSTSKQDREFALFVVPAQVGDAEPRRDAPVDGADVVARLVLAHVLELDAAAAEGTRVVARREVAHQPAGREFESPHLLGDLVRDHGTAICPRIRSTIWSVVTLSASAR